MSQLANSSLLFQSVKGLIEQSRQQVAVSVNAVVSTLYWNIGKRVNEKILENKKAEYGRQIIASLSRQLSADYGKGWSQRHLFYCIRFAETFPDENILHTLCSKLSWSHLRLVLAMDGALKREFYIEICKLERWSVRQLQERIQSMLYERTAISKKPEETIKNELQELKDTEQLSPDLVFRDPYFLGFLGLKDTYSEKDLESAIIAELQRFIIELGSDFAFMARQKRLLIDNRDYKIDLLFYHRRLRCLVAIDLKLGEFEAGDKGQMDLYLGYLEKYEMVEGENSPVGLILCAGKNEEHVELMRLHQSNIRVADYLTLLPSKEVLKDKLHKAIAYATNRLAQNENYTDHE